MAAFVQQTTFTQTGPGNNATPSLTGVVAGDSLEFVVAGGGMTDALPVDSSGQTWAKGNFSTSGTVNCATYYLLNANAGTHSITWPLGSNPDVGVAGILVETQPLTGVDVLGTPTTGTGVSTGQTASITTTNASDFCFALSAINPQNGSANNHQNIPTGWTAGTTQSNTLINYGVGIAYQEETTAGAKSAVFTYDSDTMTNRMCMIVSFKIATGASAALTAVTSTGGLGSVALAPGVALNLSSVTGTGSTGTTKANISVALTGVTGTGSAGTLAVGPPAVSGVTGSGTVGTATPNIALNLSGTSSTGAVSNLGAGAARALSAVSSTTTVTSVGANISVALTGVSSTCSVGNLQPPGNQLGPVTATGAVGQLGLTVSHALSGVSSTLTPGSVQSTPQRAISGVTATGSVGTVRLGNVVVGLTGVTAIGSAGTVSGPVPANTGAGELFAAQQMAQALTYVGFKPVSNQRGAILYTSGSWVVPVNAKSIFASATAAGGTPRGRAGAQTFRQALPARPGDQIDVNFLSNGDVSLYVGSTLLLYLFAGPAGGKDAWQSTLGQSSGIPGDFGSGVDVGRAHPPIVVLFWSPS